MAANSATALASQQSIKAYVDTQITAEDLDFSGDSGTGAVDLDSQTLAISGTASEIKTVASGQSLTISLPDDVIVGNGFTVTGIGSFYNDVKFAGSSGATGLTWDKSASALKFNDNIQLNFGNGEEGDIYRDSAQMIVNNASGNLKLRSNSIHIAGTSNEKHIVSNTGVGVTLFYNNSAKFETTNDGTVTTGIATATHFSDSLGALRDIHVRSVTGTAATLVVTDAGKVVSTNTTGSTVPASTFSEGYTITLLNNSA